MTGPQCRDLVLAVGRSADLSPPATAALLCHLLNGRWPWEITRFSSGAAGRLTAELALEGLLSPSATPDLAALTACAAMADLGASDG